MKKTLTATLPNIGEVSRTTDKTYTHVVYCPGFLGTTPGETYGAQISWASSEKLALNAAANMGFERKFKHWNGSRRVYVKGKRIAEPVIVPVNA